jgi:hypothetical protein
MNRPFAEFVRLSPTSIAEEKHEPVSDIDTVSMGKPNSA